MLNYTSTHGAERRVCVLHLTLYSNVYSVLHLQNAPRVDWWNQFNYKWVRVGVGRGRGCCHCTRVRLQINEGDNMSTCLDSLRVCLIQSVSLLLLISCIPRCHTKGLLRKGMEEEGGGGWLPTRSLICKHHEALYGRQMIVFG